MVTLARRNKPSTASPRTVSLTCACLLKIPRARAQDSVKKGLHVDQAQPSANAGSPCHAGAFDDQVCGSHPPPMARIRLL